MAIDSTCAPACDPYGHGMLCPYKTLSTSYGHGMPCPYSRNKKRRSLPLVAAFLLAVGSTALLASNADSALLQAIRDNDHARVERLLAQGSDANGRLADGSTPLAWAVDSQDAAMVALLLRAGANVDDKLNAAAAPLLLACEFGDAAVLQLLLDAGVDVTATRDDGISALAVCAGRAPYAIIEQMLRRGAAVDAADQRGQTALMHAAASGDVATLQLLLQHGADANRRTTEGFTPLMFALTSGVTEAANVIAEAGGDTGYVAPDGTTIVQMAMYQHSYDFAASLVSSERGVDLDAFDRNGHQLLHAAVIAQQPQLVTRLLAKGADPNVMTGPSQVEWRYERNFKSDAYYVAPKTPLLLATERGDAELMQLLVAAGADVNVRDEEGTNIVLAAAASGTLAALQLALQLAPDANVVNQRGDTPVHLLLNSSGRTDGSGAEYAPMMQLLAEKGARADIANKRGYTAADYATDAEQAAKDAFTNYFSD